jgi:multiple sugar transport system ATP-binding protein
MPALRIENLSKEFSSARGRVRAVDHLKLEVADGELLAVVGPSGCGKTTLLRLIAGLEEPTSGDILLDGKSILKTKAQERSIGMAFQFPALLPQLSVEENISLGPKLRGVAVEERSRRTSELAALLGISELCSRPPETLSGGQQQRVSLARALATEPGLLLLDEPLANLDPTSRIELRESIRTVQQKLGVTAIYVTHDQSEAAAVGDRVAILNGGRLQQAGQARQVYSDPGNLFVAQFFTPERPNLLAGELVESGFRPAGADFCIPAHVGGRGKVNCVIRPRGIRPGGGLKGVVEEVQENGWSTRIVLQMNEVRLRAEVFGQEFGKRGETVGFAIDPADLFFFDLAGARVH